MTTPRAVPYIMDPSESFFSELHSSLWILQTSKDIMSLSLLPRKTIHIHLFAIISAEEYERKASPACGKAITIVIHFGKTIRLILLN